MPDDIQTEEMEKDPAEPLYVPGPQGVYQLLLKLEKRVKALEARLEEIDRCLLCKPFEEALERDE